MERIVYMKKTKKKNQEVSAFVKHKKMKECYKDKNSITYKNEDCIISFNRKYITIYNLSEDNFRDTRCFLWKDL